MNVLVLISGIPSGRLPPLADATSLPAHALRYPRLSPFEEAALELTLKLRDADAAVRIRRRGCR